MMLKPSTAPTRDAQVELADAQVLALGQIGQQLLAAALAVLGEQTTALSPIKKADGMKAVLVPTGASTALMIESRRATGYDTGMAREGALVYLIDTAAGSGNGPIKVIGPAAGDAGRRTVAHGRQSDRPCCQRWR